MRIEAKLEATSLPEITASARQQEADGYHTLWTSESSHDPFLPLAIAAEHTTQCRIGCAIAVAFARNPMTLAYTVHDLQTYSQGRLAVGLGTQVRAHIQRRFSMPWSAPTARIEEFIAAVRAILHTWETGERLRFEGDFYQHTLMIPFFSPKPNGYRPPPILLAAVGTKMARAAGRAADGILTHSVATPYYLTERLLPCVREGLDDTGRDPDTFEVNVRGFLVTGSSAAELDAAKDATRAQLAFYASTPAYRPTFELHGWAELADRLHALSVSDNKDRWKRMGELIDDDILEQFAVIGTPAECAARIRDRYGAFAHSYRYYTPYPADPQLLREVVEQLDDSPTDTNNSEGSDGPR